MITTADLGMLAAAVVATLLAATGVGCPAGHDCAAFEGRLERGQRFSRPFGPGLTFVLEPAKHGWMIVVRDERPDENIARLTPPFHAPNPRALVGGYFRNADNTGPNDGSVNAPQEERPFIFHPEVGRSLDYPPTDAQMKIARAGGKGRLRIRSYELDPPAAGREAVMTRLDFEVTLSWPKAWSDDASRQPPAILPERQ